MNINQMMNKMKQNDEYVLKNDDTTIINLDLVDDTLKNKMPDNVIGGVRELSQKRLDMMAMKYCLMRDCDKVDCENTNKGRVVDICMAPSDIMYIQGMPDSFEIASTLSFSSPEKAVIPYLLENMDIYDCYFTSMFKCKTAGLPEESCNNCIDYYLRREIRYVAPKIILTDGLVILRTLRKYAIVTELPDNIEYGTIYDVDFEGTKIKAMATYDIKKIFSKTGDDYLKHRDLLWQQLCKVKEII